MSVYLESINFIVPRKLIENKYPGGWMQCLSDHKDLIGTRVWYDDHLFRDGAMNPMDMGILVNEWSDKGFNTHEGNENSAKWKDVCVVDTFLGKATLLCDWIEIEGNEAFYKGAEKGTIVSRESF
jgi:hypothetical protein